MNKNYFEHLADYFYSLELEQLDESAVRQAKRCILDFAGCGIAAARIEKDSDTVLLIRSMQDGKKEATLWGGKERLSMPLAAFANAVMTTTLELDDATSIGASVHPGAFVIPAVLAAAEKYGASGRELIKAVVFGYDVCNRMGLMSTGKIRDLGLHGPGFLGGLAAVAAAGMLSGLSLKQLSNAFSITASLAPVCPFISFIEGTDAKNLYGGWGVYLAMLAIEMSKIGMTGPQQILDGPKSLKSILASEKGTDVAPGDHYYIEDIVFKDYSACRSVHPTLTAAVVLKEREGFNPDEIEAVLVKTYPYAYDLSKMVKELNPVSARLHIPYTLAVTLYEGKLGPEAFLPEALANEKYHALMEKVTVENHAEYGSGPFGIRGSVVRIAMRSKKVFEEETHHAKWDKELPPTNEELIQKFRILTAPVLTAGEQERAVQMMMNLEVFEKIDELLAYFMKYSGAGKKKGEFV